jgi:DNA-binding beta-propeller fold protein YncE
MSNDQSDEALFDGFESLSPTAAASRCAVERTRNLLLQWVKPCETSAAGTATLPLGATPPRPTSFPSIKAKRPSRLRLLAYCGLAASFVLTVYFAILYMAKQGRVDSVALTDAFNPNNDLRHPDFGSELPTEAAALEKAVKVRSKSLERPADKALLDTMEYAVPIIHPQVADDAPVIISNGGKDPIPLGSATRKGGGLLHVWDWSKGTRSRVLPEVEFWGNMKVVLTPDGKQLVWASGKILDLRTAKWGKIDLGGADVKIDEHAYTRIGDMRFSPDGNRLALFVTNFVKNEPGHIESEVIQVVEFPTGRPLCEFPSGEQYALRIGFSADGKQILSADRGRQISRRDSATGKILKSYAPALTSQVMGVAISPDGKYVAALEREPGDLYIWESDTGRLAHQMDGGDLRKLGGHGPAYGAIRFSPDGKSVAAAYWDRLFVFDLATGKIIAALKEPGGTNIQWSADGQKLTVVTPVVVGERSVAGRENRYPTVHEWDWRNNKQIELIGASLGK